VNSTGHVSRGVEARAIPGGGWGVAFLGLVGLSLVALVLAPWPLQTKTLAILHGLCAQRPSHSLWFSRERLPFDARMTGIYGGFFMTQLYLLARGRLRAARLPSPPIVIALGLFMAAMALDGFNSLAQDLGLPTAYTPANSLRLATGGLAGTTLGVALWLLVSAAVWSPRVRRTARVVTGWRDLAAMLGLVTAFCLVTASGWPPLFDPLSVVLIAAAVLALLLVCLAVIELGKGSRSRHMRDLSGSACGALLAAYLVLLGTASFRAILEAGLHLKELS